MSTRCFPPFGSEVSTGFSTAAGLPAGGLSFQNEMPKKPPAISPIPTHMIFGS